MKFATARPYADPEAAARKLIEIANSVEAVQDGRIFIELINGPMLFEYKATPDEYGAGLKLAIERGWLSHATYPGDQTASPNPQLAAAPVYGIATERSMGDGYHLHTNLAGLALSGRRHGSILSQGRWLGRQANDPSRTGSGGYHEGHTQPAASQDLDSLGSGNSVRE
jgi:hypothetical protein